MTDQPSSPPQIHLPPEAQNAFRAVGAAAAARLSGLIDGNGFTGGQALVKSGKVEAHAIPGAVIISLAATISKSAGGDGDAQPMPSEGEARAAAEAATATLLGEPAVQRAIAAELQKDAGGGFGLPDTALDIPGLPRKNFQVTAPCPSCGGSGEQGCARCNASGEEPCLNCQGNGNTPCPDCFATGARQNPDGSRAPCPRCNASGRILCTICQGRGRTPCAQCGGRRGVPCGACGSTGSVTAFYAVAYSARLRFEPNWKGASDEARAAAEKIGLRALAADKHAFIDFQKPIMRGPELMIPCAAIFPLAQLEFTLGGKTYPATAAGMRGMIVAIEPVLDAAVKPGILALKKLASGPFAAGPLLETACKFRLIKSTLSAVTRAPKREVYKALTRDYPLVLSEKYAKAAVSYAAQALATLSNGPRMKGLAAGVLVGILPALACRFAPQAAAALGPNLAFGYAAAGVLGAGIAFMILRGTVKSTLTKLLPPDLRPGARLGWQGAAAILIPLALAAAFALLKI